MTDLMDYLPKLFVHMPRGNFLTIKVFPHFLLFSLERNLKYIYSSIYYLIKFCKNK